MRRNFPLCLAVALLALFLLSPPPSLPSSWGIQRWSPQSLRLTIRRAFCASDVLAQEIRYADRCTVGVADVTGIKYLTLKMILRLTSSSWSLVHSTPLFTKIN